LSPGLNFVSVPLNLTNESISQLDVAFISTYSDGEWSINYDTFSNALNDFEPSVGYIVYLNSAKNVSFYGDYNYEKNSLQSDSWNLIGVPNTSSFIELYPEIVGSYDYSVYEWDGEDLFEISGDTDLVPGRAYWIGVGSAVLSSPPREVINGFLEIDKNLNQNTLLIDDEFEKRNLLEKF